MKTLIVIPSRFASKRFPAKPLHLIAGRSLMARVADIAKAVCEGNKDVSYVIATDHEDIRAHADEIGAPVVMTDPSLPSGSDRALAAADIQQPDAEFIINLQGDAPFTPPSYVHALIEASETCTADVITPVIQMDWNAIDVMREQKLKNPFSGTSCIRHADGEAIWFSKMVVPAIRGEQNLRSTDPLSPVWRHVGLYGYRKQALEQFTRLPEGHYEQLEGLEQLRFIENKMQIMTVAVAPSATAMWGVDTPEDAQHAERLIAELGDPANQAN